MSSVVDIRTRQPYEPPAQAVVASAGDPNISALLLDLTLRNACRSISGMMVVFIEDGEVRLSAAARPDVNKTLLLGGLEQAKRSVP